MEYVHVACACLVGLVFAVSAAAKARDLDGFAVSLPGLLPSRPGTVPARPLAVLVIVLEALVPAAVAAPWTRMAGLVLACALLAAFTLAIGRGLAAGRPRVSCRCFGSGGAPLGRRHLVRNGLLLAAAASGLALPGTPPTAAGAVIAAAAGAVAAILIVSFDDIADLLVGSP
ncbi:MauE/DoxX family redox-associated membrane protein [Actinomadura rubrisoli]|uniref:Methylamine utilization protein MauE n=1 Tax=Actinomadura rubrisoli TaxID=2530368 RepID=A0A4R5BGU0_9ACTN|nr:MauE/DoxX family redox-associated membrane protein [Actinomadura rubrisoli]TDD84925.1 methylamine utilization protein MauE [Actinomadura rubrisoli]